MKTNFFFSILFTLLISSCFAQYSDLDIITRYNQVGAYVYGFKTGVTLPDDPTDPNYRRSTYFGTITTSNQEEAAGGSMSWVLESLIRMYETTKDKAYLYEFIRQTLELQINYYLI
jgi:hypothetical protein